MRLTEKTELYSMGNKRYKGKYKRYECNIYYSVNGYWYYCCSNDEDTINHNSLWDKKSYKSKDECHDACVKYIDEQVKIE